MALDTVVANGMAIVDVTVPQHEQKWIPNGSPTISNGEVHIEQPINMENQRPKNWVEIRDEVLWKPHRRLRVITIGAGFSGKASLVAL
jgi:hypothetical protein